MEHADLRFNLVHQADKAFLSITSQVKILLDLANEWSLKNPGPFTRSIDLIKQNELKSAIDLLGSIPKTLALEITRWKRKEHRLLSKDGVEHNLLNELYANMESMMWFYAREELDISNFNLMLVKASYAELLRCNRLL